MRASELAEPLPVVHLGTDAMEATPQRLDKAQLDHVAETEGIPTAIRFAIWRSKRRNRGRRMVEYRRRLLEYYESP